MPRRVVITGMGVISPLGNSPQAVWDALVAGRSGVGELSGRPPHTLPVAFGGEAREFAGEVDDFGPLDKSMKKTVRKGLKVMCRESQMAVVSAHLAMADSGAEAGDIDPERCGAVYGSDYMLTEPEEFSAGIIKCSDGGEFDFSRWGTDGLSEMTPLWMLKYLPNMPASHIAIFNDHRGPSNSITMREAASNLAIAEAYHTIVRDAADRMIAGATGTRIFPMKAVHASQSEQLAPAGDDPQKASRPFEAHRAGMVLGEGAATLVLEELEQALARGATIHAEVIGAGSSMVADRNLIAHRDRALANAMQAALRDAGCSPDDVGHIHAHGLSTATSDLDEARAIGQVFGDRATQVPVVAAKSNFGNLGAGSGAVELVASVLALKHGQLFPVLNYDTPDPECPLAIAAGVDISAGQTALNLNVTPQGQAAAVLVRTWTQ